MVKLPLFHPRNSISKAIREGRKFLSMFTLSGDRAHLTLSGDSATKVQLVGG